MARFVLAIGAIHSANTQANTGQLDPCSIAVHQKTSNRKLLRVDGVNQDGRSAKMIVAPHFEFDELAQPGVWMHRELKLVDPTAGFGARPQ